MHRDMEAPTAAPVSRWNLVLKGTLVVMALVLPGGSLILLGMATWRGVKSARGGPPENRSIRSVIGGAVGSLRRAAPRSSPHAQPGGSAAAA
jgi:hypothetical protein